MEACVRGPDQHACLRGRSQILGYFTVASTLALRRLQESWRTTGRRRTWASCSFSSGCRAQALSTLFTRAYRRRRRRALLPCLHPHHQRLRPRPRLPGLRSRLRVHLRRPHSPHSPAALQRFRPRRLPRPRRRPANRLIPRGCTCRCRRHRRAHQAHLCHRCRHHSRFWPLPFMIWWLRFGALARASLTRSGAS